MSVFKIPSKLTDLEVERPGELSASTVENASQTEPAAVHASYNESFDALGSALAILEQETFEATYIAIRGLEHLEPDQVLSLAGLMCQNLKTLVTCGLEELQQEEMDKGDPAVVSHRSAIEAYAFFLRCIFNHCHALALEQTKAEALAKEPKKRGAKAKAGAKGDTDAGLSRSWEPVAERIVQVLRRTLAADLDGALYRSPADKFRLVDVCVRTVVRCLEDGSVLKRKSTLTPCVEALALAATKHVNCHGSLDVAAAALFRLVLEYDHGKDVAADTASITLESHKSAALSKALVAKFCEMSPAKYDAMMATDTQPVKRAADFLEGLAILAPAVVHSVISQLMPYFDCDTASSIRSSLIACVSQLMEWYMTRELTEKGSKQLQISRQNAAQTLVERVNDKNAHVRKKALNKIQHLVSKRNWPIEFFKPAAGVAIARLEDSPLVAGAALTLLGELARVVSADSKLTDTYLLPIINRFEEQLKSMVPDVEEDGENDDPQWEAGPIGGKLPEDQADGSQGTGSQPGIIMPTQVDDGTGAPVGPGAGGMPHSQVRQLVATLKTMLDLSRMLSAALPEMESLLTSENVDVAKNAIQLLTQLSQKELQGAEGAWRRVWHLGLCGTEKVREVVLEAFDTFLDSEGPSGPRSQRDKNRSMALKLVEMVNTITVGDKEALDELVRMALAPPVGRPILGPDVVKLLLGDLHAYVNQASLLAADGGPDAAKACSLAVKVSLLCGMLARHVPELVVGDMQRVVFDLKQAHVGIKDAILVRNLATMLADLAPTLHASSGRPANGHEPASFIPAALANLLSVLVSSHLPECGGGWASAAQAAIGALYRLHPEPHKLLEPLMYHLAAETGGGKVTAAQLTRTVFIVGCVATQQLALVDGLAKRVRRERNEAEKRNAKAPTDDMASQLGAGQAMDHQLDALQEELEAKLMSDGGLIGMWGPVISGLCHNPTLLGLHADLAGAAMTTLAKLMALDVNFCDANCSIFFTRLTGGAVKLSPQVRCDMLVALGDLGRRHPNVMEPWTERMFVCLHDENEEVAKTCLRILAHLILSDMTKPKGHMAHIARCLVAPNPAIRDLSLRLFNSLASKQAKGGANKVYQYLPEIISSVTRGAPMPEQDFKAMMERLLGYVKADKLADSLKGRLCERFENVVCEFATTAGGPSAQAAQPLPSQQQEQPAAAKAAAPGGASFDDVLREWRSIADCLAMIPYSEKGLRAIMERLRCYKHALGDEHVFRVFKGLAGHGRSSNRSPELKKEVEEYETRLTEAHNQLREDLLMQAAAAAKAAEEAAAAAKAAEEAAAAKAAEQEVATDNATQQDEGPQAKQASGETEGFGQQEQAGPGEQDDVEMGGGDGLEEAAVDEQLDEEEEEEEEESENDMGPEAGRAERAEQVAAPSSRPGRSSSHVAGSPATAEKEMESADGEADADQECSEEELEEEGDPAEEERAGAVRDDDEAEYEEGDEDDDATEAPEEEEEEEEEPHTEGPVDMEMEDAGAGGGGGAPSPTPFGYHRAARQGGTGSAEATPLDGNSPAVTPRNDGDRPAGTPMSITPAAYPAYDYSNRPTAEEEDTGMAWSPAPSYATTNCATEAPSGRQTLQGPHQHQQQQANTVPSVEYVFGGFRVPPLSGASSQENTNPAFGGFRVKPDPDTLAPQYGNVFGVRVKPEPEGPGLQPGVTGPTGPHGVVGVRTKADSDGAFGRR